MKIHEPRVQTPSTTFLYLFLKFFSSKSCVLNFFLKIFPVLQHIPRSLKYLQKIKFTMKSWGHRKTDSVSCFSPNLAQDENMCACH